MSKVKYLGVIIIVIIFAIITVPNLINRIINGQIVENNRASISTPLSYVKINNEPRKVPDFLFYNQDSLMITNEDFKNKIIPPDTSKIISVEAGIGLGWQKYTRNNDNIISIESFGASGPGKELINSFGFSSDRIIEKTKLILR